MLYENKLQRGKSSKNYNNIKNKNNKKRGNSCISFSSRKKYWNEFKFLFNLDLYERYFFNNIKENKNKKFYAIDKLWLDKFKSFFEYESLKHILLVNNYNNFEEVVNKLPNDYIKNIDEKRYLLNSHEYKELIKIIQNKKYKILLDIQLLNMIYFVY